MSQRREWTASDAAEVRALFPEEPVRDADYQDCLLLAKRFGYEIHEGIPEGYWALEPRCALGLWRRKNADEKWECLRCYGSYAFDSLIREAFMRDLRAFAEALDPKSDSFVIALHSDGTSTNMKAYDLAKRFHEAYERLAPTFGYTTRPETRAFDMESANGRLMIAVCDELLRGDASS